MAPNPTPITIQEIICLSHKIRDVFGSYDISCVELDHFLRPESIVKILIVVELDADSPSSLSRIYRIISQNSWNELFVQQFTSTNKLISCLKNQMKIVPDVEDYYYLRRSTLTCEENLARLEKETIAKIFSRAILGNNNG
ncbi:MAG: hypothetical protein LBV07_01355, partial [Syntrophobacterales bacterium]|jgi:hypothetical protein|nr:hypothetical protein [Syntrophobacterales bacterium]